MSNKEVVLTPQGPQGDDRREPRLLRVEEAAFLASVSRAQIYALIADGQLPSLKIGRSRRIPLAALTRWLESRVTEQATSARAES